MNNTNMRLQQDLNELVCFNFYTGWREVEQLFRQIAGNDMTIQKSFVLTFLYGKQKSMSDISEHINLNPSAVSTLIDRMYKKGLIERVRSPSDRRKVEVKLTSEGNAVKQSLDEKILKYETILNNNICSDEKELLRAITSRIQSNKELHRPDKSS